MTSNVMVCLIKLTCCVFLFVLLNVSGAFVSLLNVSSLFGVELLRDLCVVLRCVIYNGLNCVV